MAVTLPTPGANADTWGPILNTAINSIDAATTSATTRLGALDGGTVVTPEQYGAVGDGVANDQVALQSWLSALGVGKVGKLAENKIYAHNNVLKVTQADTLIRATRTSEVYATDPNLSSFRVEANRCTIEDLRVRTNATVRLNSLDHCGITSVNGVTDLTLRRCMSTKSATTGFFIFGVTRALVEDCVTYDSLADSLHITNGSADVIVRRHTSLYGGDDGIAIVSYSADPAPVKRVRIESPRVWGQKGSGRGVAVVGGTDIMMSDVRVYRSNGAGIYVGTENNGTYTTSAAINVVIDGAELVNCNVGSALDHGAILFLSEDATKPVGPVTITDVAVRDTRRTASSEIRINSSNSGAFTGGVTLDRIHISGDGPDAVLGGTAVGAAGVTVGTVTTAKTPNIKTLSADSAITSTTGQTFLTWFVNQPGTYLIEIEGIYQNTTLDAVLFAVAGNITTLGTNIRTTINQATSTAASYRQVGGWADYQGGAPAATFTQLPFRFQAYVDIAAFPTAGTLVVNVKSAAGTVTIKAGTWGQLTKVRP